MCPKCISPAVCRHEVADACDVSALRVCAEPSQWRCLMRVVIAILLALAFPLSAFAADELTTKLSKYSVKETVDRLTAALKDKGITPVARVDHAAAAKGAGLELRPTEVLLFGNPKLGTPLMQANRRVAIDLPMKVLVWEDDAGKVWID